MPAIRMMRPRGTAVAVKPRWLRSAGLVSVSFLNTLLAFLVLLNHPIRGASGWTVVPPPLGHTFSYSATSAFLPFSSVAPRAASGQLFLTNLPDSEETVPVASSSRRRWWSRSPDCTGRVRFLRRPRRWIAAVAFATTAWRIPVGGTILGPPHAPWCSLDTAAHAKFSHELRENPTVSLRPGMTREAAEGAIVGAVVVDAEESGPDDVSDDTLIPSSTGADSTQRRTASAAKKKKQSSSSLYGDYYGDEGSEEDLLLTEADVVGSSSSSPVAAASSDLARARQMAGRTRTHFVAAPAPGQGKSTGLTVRVSAVLFGPTLGGLCAREYVRRRREETYVKKGLEILEAQKAEYFNVTGTTTPDSDVQDALKGLKNKKNATKDSNDEDDDDDDDDDDEDDDDKPQYKLRRTPRPPAPKDGGGSGSSGGGSRSSGGGDNDPGYGKPSDEDLDKLKRLMGRT